jgi:hypothetical protein
MQESVTVIYPQMQEQFTPRYLNLLTAHLDHCKDVCDNFGITTTLQPYVEGGKVTGFTVKSFKRPGGRPEDDFDFPYDPFWDDGTDFEALYGGIDDDDDDDDSSSVAAADKRHPAIENEVPADDEEIVSITKAWVSSMMADMGVCPFTQDADRSGMPLGPVHYQVERCDTFEDAYAAYWREVVRLEQHAEKDISTTLLICPEFCLHNVELFETWSNTLTQPLSALHLDDLVQLIFFHPAWSFRDGGARSSEGMAANYARRSPWPMVNILRTKQVRKAQRGIPTGLVYKQNEKTLEAIGADRLETMLRLRDWNATAPYRVDRREMDALKIAQDYQRTGVVQETDRDVRHDATPAANKVDRQQVERGNLVRVLMQALEKRLGLSDAPMQPLSGPETSATAMATDVLVEELETVIQKNGVAATATEASVKKKEKMEASTTAVKKPAKELTTKREGRASEGSNNHKRQEDRRERQRQERLEEARRAMLDDLVGGEFDRPSSSPFRGSDPLQDVMFGRGGIRERSPEDDDENFQEGMDPRTFY